MLEKTHPLIDSTTITHKVLMDAEDQAQSLDGWYQRYQQLSAGRFNGSMLSCSMPGLQFYLEKINVKTYQAGLGPSGSVAFACPLEWEGSSMAFGESMQSNALIVLGEQRSSDFISPKNFTVSGISVSVEDFLQLAAVWGCEAEANNALRHGLVSMRAIASARLRKELISFSRILENSDGGCSPRQLYSDWGSRLREAFMAAIADSVNPGFGTFKYRVSHRKIIRDAVEYMKSNAPSLISISDICSAVGVQERVLQYCFKHTFGITPTAYLRGIRLHGARRDLRVNPEERIGDVAARWGIWHPSRFSSDYRVLFGELPSETKS